MDKFKVKARTARNRVAESTSRGGGSGSLSQPLSTLPPPDDASITGVNEGFIGDNTATRDFASSSQPVPQIVEPPTSLQSSVDAGKPVPTPRGNGGSSGGRLSIPIPGRKRGNSVPTSSSRPSVGPRQSSIGMQRMPPSGGVSRPQSASTNALSQMPSRLPALEEEVQLDQVPTTTSTTSSNSTGLRPQQSRLKQVSSAISTKFGFGKDKAKGKQHENTAQGTTEVPMQYSSNMVDVLDTLDPEVQTLTSLTNIQNSLFVPNLGRLINRRPTYSFAYPPSEQQSLEDLNRMLTATQQEQAAEAQRPPTLTRSRTGETLATVNTIDSTLSESRYAVLPHGASLDGWTKEEKKELNDHVRHMLHSKRSKFKRSMRGFGQYVRRPLGFLVTLYAFLITVFGLAWVLFLIGWIDAGGRQVYDLHIIDSVLVALFAIVGDGLAPFRAVDTYHMIFIAHYHHLTWTRRKKDRLPDLRDHNDLPAVNAPMSGRNDSMEEDPEKQWEFTVLTPKQQVKLEHHTDKFVKSHSFYKPHETDTHYAFPLRLLIAIVCLLDSHSLLQISLGATTWGINYKHRHPAITTVILCCSITCNAVAGLLITIGDRRTRKKDVLERMNRQELTEEAMHHLEKKKDKESESEREGDGEASEKKERRSLDFMRHTQSFGSGKAKAKVGQGQGKEVESGESAYP